MLATPTSAIALHVEAAKRLLQELEQHAESAVDALGRDGGAEFLAAVNERDRVLGELDHVVEAIAHERATSPDADLAEDVDAAPLLAEMAHVAAAALESHEHLIARTRMERDRLAALLSRTNRPDAVASQYAAAFLPMRASLLSVTG